MPKPIKKSDDVFPPEAQDPTLMNSEKAEPAFAGLNFASREDSAKSDFKALKEGIYKVYVESAKMVERPTFNDPTKMEPTIQLTFVIGTMDNESQPILDIEGKEQAGGSRKLWASLSITATGFKNGGTTPGNTRACICALTNQDPNKQFVINSLKDLEKKQCKVFVEVITRRDGTPGNKIAKYMVA